MDRKQGALESVVDMGFASTFGDVYRGKRVLVTGHTGFKGSWLAEWLLQLGAKVTGLALAPPQPPEPSLFRALELESRLEHHLVDIRDLAAVRQVVEGTKPEFIFHLAAQPLVRLSYAEPVSTYAINVMGTAHVLEAARLAGRPCAVIAITTDKCYENREWVHSYREEDAMGGHDPYSSSKGAAELVIAAYRRSFFSKPESPVRLASARAGNVIGGGDWALDRIVPDCIRHLQKGEPIPVRNKRATRPWQHTLESLSGYLCLGARLREDATLAGAYNFGPNLTSNRSVVELVEEILKHWPGTWKDCSAPNQPHEASLLNLSIDKAFHRLGWQPVWDFQTTVHNTVVWYRQSAANAAQARALTLKQIEAYTEAARGLGVAWASQ